MITYKTEGIVLARRNFREDDRFVTFYSSDQGKVEAVAQGAKKIKSKMAGHLEPPTKVSLFIAPGKNFERVAGIKTKKSYPLIRSRFEIFLITQNLLQIVDVLTRQKYPDIRIFSLLDKTLDLLEKLSKNEERGYLKSLLLRQAFILKLLAFIGFKPELFYCIICKERIKPQSHYFSREKGGLLCQKHGAKDFKLETESVKILRLFLKSRLENILKIKIKNKIILETQEVINNYLEFHSEKRLKIYGLNSKKKQVESQRRG